MKGTEVTLEQYLRHRLPSLMAILDREGCWGYRVHMPVMFDNKLTAAIHIWTGKTKREAFYIVGWDLITGGMMYEKVDEPDRAEIALYVVTRIQEIIDAN